MHLSQQWQKAGCPLSLKLPGTFQAPGPRASLPDKLNLGSEIRNSSDSTRHSLAAANRAVAVPTKEPGIQGAGDRLANATHSGRGRATLKAGAKPRGSPVSRDQVKQKDDWRCSNRTGRDR